MREITKKLSFLVATLFYAGYFPKAPGTFGSLLSLPVIFIICFYFGTVGLMLLIFLTFIIALVSVKKVLLYSKHDPSFVIIDEFVGQSVSFLFVAETLKDNGSFFIYLTGFILFRFFDVVKPFPASYADKKIRNAFGVILDDIFAGLYAAVILVCITYLFRGI